MNYRREIDGLRALAVLPVIMFHAGFELFSGGFVGVDVFFVISGYLITTIILAELEQRKFSILNFYERRARRILPALFLIMLACLPFSWILLSPSDINSFSKSLISVTLFVSNIFFLQDGGYFETASELKPLLHTWSLAVEEQYYVFFPLLLMLLWKFGKRLILIFLLLLFIISLNLAQWGTYSRTDASFFLLPTRGWELLIGAFAAFYLSNKNYKEFDEIISEVFGWLGLFLIFYAVFFFNKSTPFPGIYALVPTLGTVLIILFGTKKTYIGKFVGNKAFVGIGLISYSAYLWHQPILAFARHYFVSINNITNYFLIFIIMIFSYLSWKFVEIPFRIKDNFSKKFFLFFCILFTQFFIIVGYASSKIDFFREEAMAKELSVSSAIFSSNINERIFIKNRILYENIKPDAVLIGSSRLMQASSKGTGFDLINLSVSGASIQDLIAIWELSSYKFNPSYVFIGADPWIFNLNSNQQRWIALGPEYTKGMSKIGVHNELIFSNNDQPFRFNSIFLNFYNSINLSKIRAEDDSRHKIDKIRKDGSRVYNSIYANKSVQDLERDALKYISYGMTNYKYSSDVRIILERFVSELKTQNRKVVFVLSPFHPKLFEYMRQYDRKFMDIESIFREIAEFNGVFVIGSFDPTMVGCTEYDFYDGLHPKERCMNQIFSELKK